MAMELRDAGGEGFATMTADGRVLDSWFLRLRLTVEADKAATVMSRQARASFGKMAGS